MVWGEFIDTDKHHVTSTQEELYSKNIFVVLPPKVGILIGIGLAKLCFASPIKTIKSTLRILAYQSCPSYQSQTGDVSSLDAKSQSDRANDEE